MPIKTQDLEEITLLTLEYLLLELEYLTEEDCYNSKIQKVLNDLRPLVLGKLIDVFIEG